MLRSSGYGTAARNISGSRYHPPFAASQWQELEQQALVYKYMISGMPIPPDLLFTIKTSLDSSLSSNLILHHPPQHPIGWNCFQMGFGRKIDPEPGRCRRTDGKKWRCSKEAYPDSKYCERHMHRGRNRSRKPVEIMNSSGGSNPLAAAEKSRNCPSHAASPHSLRDSRHHAWFSGGNDNNNPFYGPHSPSPFPRSLGVADLSSHDLFLVNSNGDDSGSGYSYRHGAKEATDGPALFFRNPVASKTLTASSMADSPWQFEPLPTGSSSPAVCSNPRTTCSTDNPTGRSYLQLQSHESGSGQQRQGRTSCGHGLLTLKTERRDEPPPPPPPQKVMHRFFDEWPHPGGNDSNTTTQLSISISNSASSHDFFSSNK